MQLADSVGFEQRLEMQGIGFGVSSPNSATGNSVIVTTTGLEIDNSPWEFPAAAGYRGRDELAPSATLARTAIVKGAQV